MYPLFHMGAWTISLQAFQTQTTFVVVLQADAALICDAVESWQATHLNAIPAVWQRVLDHVAERTAAGRPPCLPRRRRRRPTRHALGRDGVLRRRAARRRDAAHRRRTPRPRRTSPRQVQTAARLEVVDHIPRTPATNQVQRRLLIEQLTTR
jgi:hypothetical protein